MNEEPGRLFFMRFATLGGAFLLTAVAWGADGKSASMCSRVNLENAPGSIAAAVWQHGEQGVVLLANDTRSLVLYDLAGKRTRRVSSPGDGPYDFNVPLGIQQTDDGYLVNDENQHFVWLDAAFKGVDSFDVRKDRRDGADEIWLDAQSIVSGKEATGVLSRSARDGADYGIFRMRLQRGAEPRLVRAIDVPGDRAHHAGSLWSFRMYQAEYRLLAKVGDRVYWLELDPSRRLHLMELGAAGAVTELEGVLPAISAQWPKTLPENVSVEDVPAVLATLERATLVSGLFSDGERLFVLAHTPAAQGLRWSVLALDRAARHVEFERELPTAAPEIVVLPGARRFALVELGAVSGHLRPPKSLLLLSREWLTAAPGRIPACGLAPGR